MNFIKKIILYSVLLSLVFIPREVYAWGKDGSSRKEGGSFHQRFEQKDKMIKEIFSQLNLTEDQKNKLEENKKKNVEQMKVLSEQKKTYRDAFNKELLKPELDMDKINQIRVQLKDLQAKKSDARFNSIIEVRKTLTHPQFVKFMTLMEEHKKEFSSMRGKFGGSGKSDE